jgi:tricorn protease
VAHSTEGRIADYAWSPGGGYLAFSMNNPNMYSALHIWSAKESKLRRVSSGIFNEDSPAWDPAGDYLYFLAYHEFRPQLSLIEFDFAANRLRGIFALALRKEVKNPFPPESDEVAIKKDKAKDDKGKDEKGEKAKEKEPEEPKDRGIDFDGLERRATRVPLDANNYSGLRVKTDALVYEVFPAPY